MVNPNRFYTYAYLREDRTPYYIGKGKGNRAYRKYKGEIKLPKDKSRIIFLKQNITEEEAFKHEIYMIAVFGRKDLGTGILRNKTNGGEGNSGWKMPDETKQKIGKIHKGKNLSKEHKDIIINSRKGRVNSKEHNELIAKAITGITRSKETRDKIRKSKIGANNPKSNWWKLTFLNGDVITICGISNWAKENNYEPSNIHHVYTKKQKRHKDIISVEKLS
jgi:hypothetical protein